MKVSILMLTHNAPKYVYQSIKSLTKTINVDYELIVVDNASNFINKILISWLSKKGYIDKVHFNSYNSLFAKGNNLAGKLASEDSDYFLLLNSDIQINNPLWLSRLLEVHPAGGGISSYGAVMKAPIRADGFCMLINKNLYLKYGLDENFAWWWSVTKLQSEILKEGKKILAVKCHEEYIHHFGGKSGKGFKDAAGMDVKLDEVKTWFNKGSIEVLESLS